MSSIVTPSPNFVSKKKISRNLDDFSSSAEDDSESDEDSLLSADSLASDELEGLKNDMEDSPGIEFLMEETDNQLNSGVLASNFTKNEDGFVSSDDESIIKRKTNGKSIAHKYLVNGGILYSFDLEHGGEHCGILQISAQIIRIRQENNVFVTEVEDEVFDKYVKPPSNAIWSEHAVSTHGLHRMHINIVNAEAIEVVWEQFVQFIDRHIGQNQRATLVAWNGETCDLKWIYKLTQAHGSTLDIPDKLWYFLDPLRIINYYKSCKLNRKHSKLDSYSLESVWQFISNKPLDGAHDSLVDVKAQTDVLTHESFLPFIDRAYSIRPIELLLSYREASEVRKGLETNRPVHGPWIELDQSSASWEFASTLCLSNSRSNSPLNKIRQLNIQ